ncbi:hypothetical protein RJ641_012382 [Dillenia turbinata]|uniref:Uncharacterized protein n=1 Tax=Dillenia turbinata TaxID=194707 RepID=A0AAN8UU39_9MAGN
MQMSMIINESLRMYSPIVSIPRTFEKGTMLKKNNISGRQRCWSTIVTSPQPPNMGISPNVGQSQALEKKKEAQNYAETLCLALHSVKVTAQQIAASHRGPPLKQTLEAYLINGQK